MKASKSNRAPIAQLDRAPAYEAGGRRFEPSWAQLFFTRTLRARREPRRMRRIGAFGSRGGGPTRSEAEGAEPSWAHQFSHRAQNFFMGRRGFTLVEIMIVVGILALLATMAISSFLRSRLTTNETVAIRSVRTLSTAIENYRADQTPITYPSVLTDLSDVTPPYIDSVLASGTKQGYTYSYESTAGNSYSLTASPEESGITGSRIFFVDETGVIRLQDISGTPL